MFSEFFKKDSKVAQPVANRRKIARQGQVDRGLQYNYSKSILMRPNNI